MALERYNSTPNSRSCAGRCSAWRSSTFPPKLGARGFHAAVTLKAPGPSVRILWLRVIRRGDPTESGLFGTNMAKTRKGKMRTPDEMALFRGIAEYSQP